MVSNRYWEKETPMLCETTKNTLRWFSEAGRLQISAAPWEDKTTGEQRPGKMVSLNVTALAGNAEAVRILTEVLEAIKDDMEVA